VGGAVANQQQVVPTHEAFFEYGHTFRFRDHWIRGWKVPSSNIGIGITAHMF